MPVTFGQPSPFEIRIEEQDVARAVDDARRFDLDKYLSGLLSCSLDTNDFTRGITPELTRALVERLRSGYDWRQWERKLNDLGSHYMVQVDGIPDEPQMTVHIVEARSDDPNAIPLVLCHGWPGSILEFYKIVETLTHPDKPDQQAFHCILPSLPGYTFSSPPKSRDWQGFKAAAAVDAAVQALGYTKYIAQGGDLGWTVSSRLASEYPERCRAVHLNFLPPPANYNPPAGLQLSELDREGLAYDEEFARTGGAYFKMNATVPYTVGLLLSSSPIAAVAYIGEKFYRWSEVAPGIDEVLTATLLYYFTGSTTSSLWLYAAPSHDDHRSNHPVLVPSAWTGGARDLFWAPKAEAEKQYKKLLVFKKVEAGGHFLALERPDILAREIREFVWHPLVQESFAKGI